MALTSPEGCYCLVCKKRFGNYTCPRCGAHYCSIDCFKHHSESCTNAFYADQVRAQLKAQVISEEQALRMRQLLGRFYRTSLADETLDEEFNDGDDHEEDEEYASLLAQISEAVDNGEEAACEVLTKIPDHWRQKILHQVDSGQLSAYISIWQPWWLLPRPMKPKVTVKGEKQDQESYSKLPEMEKGIPSLSSLTSRVPSPQLAYNLINIIYAYVITLREYNGKWQTDALETFQLVLAFSSVLSSNRNFNAVAEAMSECMQIARMAPLFRPIEECVAALKDAVALLECRHSVVLALSDLYRWSRSAVVLAQEEFRHCAQEAASSTCDVAEAKKSNPKREIQLMQAAQRKIYFFLVWSHQDLLVENEEGEQDPSSHAWRLLRTQLVQSLHMHQELIAAAQAQPTLQCSVKSATCKAPKIFIKKKELTGSED